MFREIGSACIFFVLADIILSVIVVRHIRTRRLMVNKQLKLQRAQYASICVLIAFFILNFIQIFLPFFFIEKNHKNN